MFSKWYMWSCWALAFSTGEKTHAWTSSWEACSSWSEQGCYHYIGVGGGRDMVATSMTPPCTCFWNWKRTVIYIYMTIVYMSTFFCKSIMNSILLHADTPITVVLSLLVPCPLMTISNKQRDSLKIRLLALRVLLWTKKVLLTYPHAHTSWYSGYPQWPHRCSVWELDSIFLLSMIKMCPEACIPYQCSIIL